MYTHTYKHVYLHLHTFPSVSQLNSVQLNCNYSTDMSNNQTSVQSLNSFSLAHCESSFFIFYHPQPFFKSAFSTLVYPKNTSVISPTLPFPILSPPAVPKTLLFLCFFLNGGCSFSQLILILTLQLMQRLCRMNFFNFLLLQLQTYQHLDSFSFSFCSFQKEMLISFETYPEYQSFPSPCSHILNLFLYSLFPFSQKCIQISLILPRQPQTKNFIIPLTRSC